MSSSHSKERRDKLEDDFENLAINDEKPKTTSPRGETQTETDAPATRSAKSKKPVVDSWEDALSDSDSDKEASDAIEPPPARARQKNPQAAPPAQDDLVIDQHPWLANPSQTTSASSWSGSKEPPRVRPEKQTAVASRMIAGALGIRAPKRTEEQRAYDRAMKEKEIKRRNRLKEEQEKAKQEEERLKAAIWES
ncbi:hypothetical protein VTN49DRAFT_7633 [Thermomyces lanuginosus]|uniref:uncharacterized protein n=1 Tax=Thermomyces lanuginosus TaxID=5541 RepID=UPI0037434B22